MFVKKCVWISLESLKHAVGTGCGEAPSTRRTSWWMSSGQRKSGVGGNQSGVFFLSLTPRVVLAAAWTTARHSGHALHHSLSAKSEIKPEYNIHSFLQPVTGGHSLHTQSPHQLHLCTSTCFTVRNHEVKSDWMEWLSIVHACALIKLQLM